MTMRPFPRLNPENEHTLNRANEVAHRLMTQERDTLDILWELLTYTYMSNMVYARSDPNQLQELAIAVNVVQDMVSVFNNMANAHEQRMKEMQDAKTRRG